MIDLLSLPLKTANIIYNFVDNQTLPRMREVCKVLNETVCELLGEHKGKFFYFDARPTEIDQGKFAGQQIAIGLGPRTRLLWLLCLVSKFGIEVINTIFEQDRLRTVNEVKNFTGFLKARIHGKVFEVVIFDRLSPEMLQIFSKFVDDNTVISFDFIPFVPGVIDYSYWIDKSVKWNVSRAKFSNLPTNKDSYNFILEMANIVENLWIVMMDNGSASQNVPISMVKNILARRVNSLIIYPEGDGYSLSDMECLVKVFHTLDKKIQFTTYTNILVMEKMFGMYKLKKEGWKFTKIAHVETIFDD